MSDLASGYFRLANFSLASDKPDVTNWLKDRVETRLQALGLGPIEAAANNGAGLQRDYIDNIVKGKKRSVRSDGATKLSVALEAPAEYFLFENYRPASSQKRDHEQSAYGTKTFDDVNQTAENSLLQHIRVSHYVPVLGKAEAGEFRVMFNDNAPESYIPMDLPEFEGIDLFAYEVVGPSMNEVFQEGTRVVCRAFNPKELRDRDFVILRDTKGPEAEISIKEFRIGNKGQWEFWPRSTNARFQDPIFIPERNEYQQDGIDIIGIVLFEAPARIKRTGRFAVRRD